MAWGRSPPPGEDHLCGSYGSATPPTSAFSPLPSRLFDSHRGFYSPGPAAAVLGGKDRDEKETLRRRRREPENGHAGAGGDIEEVGDVKEQDIIRESAWSELGGNSHVATVASDRVQASEGEVVDMKMEWKRRVEYLEMEVARRKKLRLDLENLTETCNAAAHVKQQVWS